MRILKNLHSKHNSVYLIIKPMKTKILLTLVVALLMTSCSTTSFYQLYKAVPETKDSKGLVGTTYEDENVVITYNFWDEEGNIGFVLTNKTANDIWLNKEESYFVLNGFAYPYYQSRVFTKGNSRGSSSSVSGSTLVNYNNVIYPSNLLLYGQTVRKTNEETYFTESSVSMNEEKIVCIPAGTSRSFQEYTISAVIYRDCNLFLYPSASKIKTLKFVERDSPIKFGNRLTYQVKGVDEPVRIKNEFYVSEITNYPQTKFLENKYEEFCGEKSAYYKKFFIYEASDTFYNTYIKKESWKH